MLNRLILKVIKFQLSPPKRLGTVVKNILEWPSWPPMSNRVNVSKIFQCDNGSEFKGEMTKMLEKQEVKIQ